MVIEDLVMTNVLAVVGERRDDPDHLLLLGDDGHYYDLRLTDGATIPTAPSEEWIIDVAATMQAELTV